MGIKRWRRGQGEGLSPHFKAKEFECQDGMCSEQFIDMRLIERLEEARVEVGLPFTIKSGFRCARHQQQLREQGYETAAGTSTHELGQAADVACADMAKLEAALTKRFDAVGVAKTFIHVDLRADKKRRWGYSK